MVFESDGAVRALGVDRVHGIRQVVVKELDESLGSPHGLSGATILGDGSAVLILDPNLDLGRPHELAPLRSTLASAAHAGCQGEP